MAEPDNSPFAPAPAEENERNWLPMAIGGVLVIVAIAVVFLISRTGSSANPSQASAYAANLQISGLHMATAENFAGGSVTYILGTVKNAGDKKVTGASVQVLFKNSLREIAQKETLPLLAVLPNTPYTDYGTLDRAPLAAGQERDFRVTLEHISADWDGQIPTVRVVSVTN